MGSHANVPRRDWGVVHNHFISATPPTLRSNNPATLGAAPPTNRALLSDLSAIQREWAPALDPAVIELALDGWTHLVGLISAEVFGQLGRGTLSEPEEFFTRAVERLAASLGLPA